MQGVLLFAVFLQFNYVTFLYDLNLYNLYQAKKFAPVDLNWEKVPGGFNYNISNFNLEIKFLKAEINTRINISPGKWVNENKLKFLPLSTLTKKALNFLI